MSMLDGKRRVEITEFFMVYITYADGSQSAIRQTNPRGIRQLIDDAQREGCTVRIEHVSQSQRIREIDNLVNLEFMR
jgi:hypothetical protein